MAFNSKYKNLTPSYFTKIRPEIEKYHAINLIEGYTGFHCSEKLVDLVKKYVFEGLNQYGDPYGERNLRDRIAEKVKKLYGHYYDPEKEITITAGSTQAISTTISAIIREGDEVIIFEPACNNVVSAIKINGGQPVFIPIDKTGFKIDWEQVQKMINANTRMIVINTPHSPTGMILNELDMLRLQKIISGTNMLILSNETFEHIVFDGEAHQSMASFPILTKKSIIVSSFGETFHVTGWQTGYCMAPEEIMTGIRRIHEITIGRVNTPFQLAFADFLQYRDEYLSLNDFYQAKRDLLNSMLETTGFKPVISKGSYFQLLDYSKVSKETDIDFALRLIRQYGVALTPLSVFTHTKPDKHFLRINFAQPDDILKEVTQRLSTVE